MSISDEWQTPQKLFDDLSKKYGPFDIDLCANRENSKCDYYYSDYLKDTLTHKTKDLVRCLSPYELSCNSENITAWMNPPYSNPLPFIEKAWKDSKYCKIVLLVKVDPSTKWWSTFWMYDEICPVCYGALDTYLKLDLTADGCPKCEGTGRYSGPALGCKVEFLHYRVQFDPPTEMNAWKEKVECKECIGMGHLNKLSLGIICNKCDGKGYKEGKSWYVKCEECKGKAYINKQLWSEDRVGLQLTKCPCLICKGTGKRKFAGPSFASAVLIFNRGWL